ncbi:MAG: trypsin-like serine protease, partial [Clostridia bacterium]|nr:trypsin-like serine protease [Clostridia bacterium]
TEDGSGAGVIYEINEEEQFAYIITNYHVVVLSTTVDSTTTYAPATDIYFYTYGAETVGVTMESEYNYGNKFYMAEYVGGSADYDIAVLKVTGEYFTRLNATDAETVTFADTTNLQPGTTAIAIGNPLGEGIAVTSGVVSVSREMVSVSLAGADRTLPCLRLDAAINGGNSGGGVFDINGNLIGITNAKYSSVAIENVANAILASNVKNVVENIVYFYEQNFDELAEDNSVGVHKYVIGFSSYDLNPTNTYNSENFTNNKSADITVDLVGENSIASEIGLAVGDIVRSLKIKRAGSDTFQTISFNTGYEISNFMLTARAGDEIVLVVDRLQSGTTDTYVSTDLTSFTVDSSKYVEYKNNSVIE